MKATLRDGLDFRGKPVLNYVSFRCADGSCHAQLSQDWRLLRAEACQGRRNPPCMAS